MRAAGTIPPNQWVNEVQLWFAANLANTQQRILGWIAKAWPKGHPEAMYKFVNVTALDAPYDKNNVTTQKQNLCRNQLIRSNAAVQNFSVLALVLVVVLCGSLIVAALLLPKLREPCSRVTPEERPGAIGGGRGKAGGPSGRWQV